MPSREHVCYHTGGLNTKWIGVDLGLIEMVGMILEPQKKVVLEGEGFNGSADWGPKEKNPASLNVSWMTKSSTWMTGLTRSVS